MRRFLLLALCFSFGALNALVEGNAAVTSDSSDPVAPSATPRVAPAEGWSFQRHVIPILTKAGCNTGGCHGALAGKGGFRLSLSAYDSAADYLSITRDALGRRIETGDPLHSLLLTKPTAAMPHKGGRRLDPRSDDYRILAEWIAAGAEGPRAEEAQLARLEVIPEKLFLKKGDRAQLKVLAHYADGLVEDVTRWTRFTATDETLLRVSDPNGGLEVTGYGEGAVSAWFSSRIILARVTSPFPVEKSAEAESLPFPLEWENRNVIDVAINTQLRQLNLVPSRPADDATFLRRAYLDTTGALPSPEKVSAFLADPNPKKRDGLIEQLLYSNEYTDYWSYRWADLFLISGSHLRPASVKTYAQWLRAEVEKNVPWDVLVREVVTARGGSMEMGATNFYAVHQDPETMAENVSQAFMGLSINCAKCHNHPLEKWTNDQYYAFANLFSRVRAKGWGGDARSGDGARTLYSAPSGDLLQPRTGRAQPAAPLDAVPVKDVEGVDRREALAAWLTAPQNPYFTRAIVNRVWAGFFGIGIVNPVDDLRASNPAANEPLLAALTEFLVAEHCDLKALMRLILQSAAYQRSSEPLPRNREDTRYFSRYYPRRLGAEVLNDAICSVTAVPEAFTEILLGDGSSEKTEFYPKGSRALQLFDSSVKSYFLKAFGRNQREITCECERSSQPSVIQALHLANGTTLNGKLAAPTGFVSELLLEPKDDAALVNTAFLRCLGRAPTAHEKDVYLELLSGVPEADRRASVEDLFWSLLTSREFLFQH